DMIDESRRRLQELAPQSPDAIRQAARPVVAFSGEMTDAVQSVRRFLFARMYRHPVVTERTDVARQVVRDLFEALNSDPTRLPNEWAALTDGAASTEQARLVADYIAGMTDRFAFREHERFFPDRRPAGRWDA
ncbi:MAG: deoxyguanosinetriphosphate triphosphohydrolase, partial [Alphaproteobacteria bacterium]